MTLLCRVEELTGGSGKGFTVEIDGEATEILVVAVAGEVRAYVNACPHLGINLDWQPDRFLDRDREHIICSTHGALFRVADGYCFAGPCRGEHLDPVAIAIEDGAVRLRATAASPPA